MRFFTDSRLGINGQPQWLPDEFTELPEHERFKTIRLPSETQQHHRLPSDDMAPTPLARSALT